MKLLSTGKLLRKHKRKSGVSQSTNPNCYATGTVSGTNQVGGVAGWVFAILASSSITNCAALNPSATGTSYVGRVAGDNSGGTLSGNVTFDGMKVNGSTVSSTDAGSTNGADKTAANITAASFFQTLFGSNTAWTYATGKLPVLKGLAGQSAEMPGHILEKLTSPFAGGGTSADPYRISTAAELETLARLVNAKDTTYNAAHYNCYATGAVSATNNVGGVAGYVGGGSIINCAALNPNEYAQFFLDRFDNFQDQSMFMAATRLLQQLSKIFEEQHRQLDNKVMRIDRKRMRLLQEKKIEQGHARDDHEQTRNY